MALRLICLPAQIVAVLMCVSSLVKWGCSSWLLLFRQPMLAPLMNHARHSQRGWCSHYCKRSDSELRWKMGQNHGGGVSRLSYRNARDVVFLGLRDTVICTECELISYNRSSRCLACGRLA